MVLLELEFIINFFIKSSLEIIEVCMNLLNVMLRMSEQHMYSVFYFLTLLVYSAMI